MAKSSRLLIDEQPLQVIPTLACKMGLNRAMFLQQLHYWLQKPSAHERDGKRWIHNTFEEWHEQFPFWTPEAIRKIVSQLEDKNIIETTDKYNARKGDRTKWYTIDYDRLNALFDDQPENSPQPDQPEKSTEQPEKSTDHEPEKSTERYQRGEKYYRDSDLQSGGGDAAPSQTSSELDQKRIGKETRAECGKELMERVAVKREEGASIHSPTDSERGQFAKFYDQARIDGYDRDTRLLALDYQVAKAAGEVDGEVKAWCGYRTALDRVNDGWRPAGSANARTAAERDELEQQNAEIARMHAEIFGPGGVVNG